MLGLAIEPTGCRSDGVLQAKQETETHGYRRCLKSQFVQQLLHELQLPWSKEAQLPDGGLGTRRGDVGLGALLLLDSGLLAAP